MTKYLLAIFMIISVPGWTQSNGAKVSQFVLFDVEFTYTKADADNSTPSKSHYYVTHEKLSPHIPKDWTSPVDFRNGTVHIRLEVLEKPPAGRPQPGPYATFPTKAREMAMAVPTPDSIRMQAFMKKMCR